MSMSTPFIPHAPSAHALARLRNARDLLGRAFDHAALFSTEWRDQRWADALTELAASVDAELCAVCLMLDAPQHAETRRAEGPYR
jgi:hypothetical protein